MIPAFVVQSNLQEIVNATDDDSDALFTAISVAEDMGLLKILGCDDQGRPNDIEWIKQN